MTDAYRLAAPEQVRPNVDCNHCGTTIVGTAELDACACGADICSRCTGGWCIDCKRALHNECAHMIECMPYCADCGAKTLDSRGGTCGACDQKICVSCQPAECDGCGTVLHTECAVISDSGVLCGACAKDQMGGKEAA